MDRQAWLEARAENINSTECGALFGFADSTYIPTLFELWHQKKDRVVVDFEPDERIKWGVRIQDSIAAGVAEEKGWQIRKKEEYLSIPELRLGASFDFEINMPDGKKALLEIKNTDSLIYKKKWNVDGDNIEAPISIELQLQHQLLVSKIELGFIGCLVGGNRLILVERKADQEIHDAIKRKSAAFWKSIDTNTPPAPDFTRDAAFISKLYGYAEIGKVYEADEEITTLAKRWKELGDAMSACDKERDAIKSQLLIKIGDSEKVIGDQFSISAGLIGPAEVSYHRDGYRAFRVNWKKGAK